MSPDSNCIKQGRVLGEVIPEGKKENPERKGDRRQFSQIFLCCETPQRSSSESLLPKWEGTVSFPASHTTTLIFIQRTCHPQLHQPGACTHSRDLGWSLCTLTSVVLGEGWMGLQTAYSSGRYHRSTQDNGQKRALIWGILFGWMLTFPCWVFPSRFLLLYEILSPKPIKAIFHPQWTLEGCNNHVHDLGIHLTSALNSSVVDVAFT